MGWTRKILRVNLTSGTCTSEPLNMEWANAYLGQRGLASKYLAEEIDPKCDPLGPDNKLIMATGPLTGTTAATGGRYSVVTKSPLTNLIACSNSGGFIGAEMKFAGWDMIIFEGKAESPVYLNVVNAKAELLSAADIWGKSVCDAYRKASLQPRQRVDPHYWRVHGAGIAQYGRPNSWSASKDVEPCFYDGSHDSLFACSTANYCGICGNLD